MVSKVCRKACMSAILVVLFESIATAAFAGSCAAYTNCPLDGAQSMKVDTEYQGIVAIGVFEHTTTTGQKHRFRKRCD